MSEEPLTIKYALDTWKEGRKSLKRKDEIAIIWDSLQELIDSGEIWNIWNENDNIESKRPVFYIENGHLIESHTDKYGWPNTTFDGVLMYNNTHFRDKEEAINSGIKNAEEWIKIMKEGKKELLDKLKKKDEIMQREWETIQRLKQEVER